MSEVVEVRANDGDCRADGPSSTPKSTSAWDRIAETGHVTRRISRSPGTPAYLLGRPEGEWQKAIRTISGRPGRREMLYEEQLAD